MRKFSENRFLADLYTKDAVQAVFFQELIDRMDNIAKSAGVAMVGDLTPPPPVNAINVKASGEMVHVTLTHAAELTRAIEYHVEADTNPGFTAPQIVSQGSRRTHLFNLPAYNDSGVQQRWYVRAYAQYPGSKPSQPLVFGGLANPTPVTLQGGAGGTKLTPLGSTGSGTASTTGQQGGAGRGKARVSTPKVIRIGRQQAAVQPTQTTVQPGGQPVIIFTPEPNGNTPPVVVVDQSGGGGIDFSGKTPITGRLSANGTAFADLSGNLLLKNISSPTPSTSGPSTSSTTYAVIPEMTTTITTKGNPVLLLLTMQATTTQTGGSGNACNFSFFMDGTQITTDFAFVNAGIVAAGWTYCFSFLTIPSAASHTFDARWKVATVNATITTIGIQRTFQVLELG